MSDKTIPLTNDLLKVSSDQILINRGTCLDFDTCKTAGYYQVVYCETKNIPPGAYEYGILTVKSTISFVSQEYLPHTSSGGVFKTFTRMWTAGTWSVWHAFTAS